MIGTNNESEKAKISSVEKSEKNQGKKESYTLVNVTSYTKTSKQRKRGRSFSHEILRECSKKLKIDSMYVWLQTKNVFFFIEARGKFKRHGVLM